MTTKERLHKLVDELSDGEADDALEFIATQRKDPLLRVIANAPEDDEPWTAEDEAAMAEVRADRAAGLPMIPFEEIKRKYEYP
jgi:hypothetical protein